MVVKQYRKHPDRAARSRSFYLPTELLALLEREAQAEGHNNLSTVVVKALTAYFGQREAEEQTA